ncbi:MAG TPA: glycosyltransferase family 39 protein [Anaerolineales bacterium]|nr:glycosyltransferase family 39 protein [Anaerolineales bacterium]
MKQQRVLPAIAILAWSGFVIAAYFVVQKPLALQVMKPLITSIWGLVVFAVLLLNALALGVLTLRRFVGNLLNGPAVLALACGIGLGELGLLGFLLAATGASDFIVLLGVQALILGWSISTGKFRSVVSLMKEVSKSLLSFFRGLPFWMRWAVFLALTFTFLMTLLPPADAFDALLYHLTIPELWLADGGIQLHNFPHYWFPGLIEGIYLWGLGLGSEIVPQQVHFAFALCSLILLCDWTRRLWGELASGWAVMLFISMPNILLLASWAYTDLALIFFGLGMLYTLSMGKELNDTRWWRISAVSAGMAMGVKYTSFFMPVTAVLLIAAWNFQKKRELLEQVFNFTLISTLTGLIWYLRNWFWMGNPIYPFLLGGRFWDEFRAAWYANAGTGIGWDIGALILLPLTVTLGYQDVNGIDADIGPLLLLTLPLALWAVTSQRHAEQPQKISLATISLFSLIGMVFWVYGYISTRNLWQARLLLPAIVPFLIITAVGVTSLSSLDSRRLRISFIVSTIVAASIFVNLLDMGLILLSRNPLAIATGIVTKESYLSRYQPGYADALRIISQLSPQSKTYFLFEPRSYGMHRAVQPDAILDNFSHDIFLHKTPEDIISAWQAEGYTHVLVNKRNAEAILENRGEGPLLDEVTGSLKLVSVSQDENYELFEIPFGASK